MHMQCSCCSPPNMPPPAGFGAAPAAAGAAAAAAPAPPPTNPLPLHDLHEPLPAPHHHQPRDEPQWMQKRATQSVDNLHIMSPMRHGPNAPTPPLPEHAVHMVCRSDTLVPPQVGQSRWQFEQQ
jgi:hypothetical protein